MASSLTDRGESERGHEVPQVLRGDEDEVRRHLDPAGTEAAGPVEQHRHVARVRPHDHDWLRSVGVPWKGKKRGKRKKKTFQFGHNRAESTVISTYRAA